MGKSLKDICLPNESAIETIHILDVINYESALEDVSVKIEELSVITCDMDAVCNVENKLTENADNEEEVNKILIDNGLVEEETLKTESGMDVKDKVKMGIDKIKEFITKLVNKFLEIFNKLKEVFARVFNSNKMMINSLKAKVELLGEVKSPYTLDIEGFGEKIPAIENFGDVLSFGKLYKEILENFKDVISLSTQGGLFKINPQGHKLKDGEKYIIEASPSIKYLVRKDSDLNIETKDIKFKNDITYKGKLLDHGQIKTLLDTILKFNNDSIKLVKDVEWLAKYLKNVKVKDPTVSPVQVNRNCQVVLETGKIIVSGASNLIKNSIFIAVSNMKCYESK